MNHSDGGDDGDTRTLAIETKAATTRVKTRSPAEKEHPIEELSFETADGQSRVRVYGIGLPADSIVGLKADFGKLAGEKITAEFTPDVEQPVGRRATDLVLEQAEVLCAGWTA